MFPIKNIIIGIDGGTFTHILRYFREDLLPNFKKLIENGFSANLKVTTPPVTIPSFPCIFSGLSVEDLGVCTFYDPSFGIFSSNLWRDKSILSLKQLKTLSINLPSTYPAWQINGEMITGLLTPTINNKMYFPNNIGRIIKDDWIIDGNSIAEIFKAFSMKSKLFIEKLQENFNLGIYVIRVPDCITHHPQFRLKQTDKTLLRGYREIDKFLGEILNKVEFDNLFLISDHGLKLYKNEFNIRRFLEKKKILFYNDDFTSKFLSLFIKLLGYFNQNLFETIYFHNKFMNFLKRITRKKITEDQNHTQDNTRFIHFYSNFGGIYLNKKDKQKRESIKQILLKSKYIKQVIIYDSKYLPDILIELQHNYLYSVKSSYFVKNKFNSYNHSEEGIFIAYGKNVKRGKRRKVSYLDFAPTLLKIYNIEIPDHMTGQVLDILDV